MFIVSNANPLTGYNIYIYTVYVYNCVVHERFLVEMSLTLIHQSAAAKRNLAHPPHFSVSESESPAVTCTAGASHQV